VAIVLGVRIELTVFFKVSTLDVPDVSFFKKKKNFQALNLTKSNFSLSNFLEVCSESNYIVPH